jgi:sodium/bile acid cotransporter 7
MLKRLPTIPFDAFLLALGATVALAAPVPRARRRRRSRVRCREDGNHTAVLPLWGSAIAASSLARCASTATAPAGAGHNVRDFPGAGAGRSCVGALNADHRPEKGLLFLCLVPSTVQSSIAFTSIARGHVSAAIVSASLSNILGIVLTPLLVVLLMNTGGAPRVDGTAIRDIVPQLLLPFGAGQLARRWIAGAIARYAALLKVVDRGSILLVVYTAFSMGMVEGIWGSVDVWQLILLTIVAAVLLAVVLAITTLIGRLARLDRGDAVVLLFCGSKKSLASGLPMALVFFPAATVGLTMLPLMIFHQIQLVVCAVIASRLAREADESSAHSVAGPAVPAPEAGEEP